MTRAKVIKAMEAAGITGEVTGHGVNWEVELPDEETMERFTREVAPAGGFKTGYGAWILQADYQDRGDWNNPASRWHY